MTRRDTKKRNKIDRENLVLIQNPKSGLACLFSSYFLFVSFRVASWIKVPSTIFGAVRVNQKIRSDEAQQHPGNHGDYLKKFVARYVRRMRGVKQNRPAQARNSRSDDSVARDERRHTKLPDLCVLSYITQFSRLIAPVRAKFSLDTGASPQVYPFCAKKALPVSQKKHCLFQCSAERREENT
jgi:hypothetical protein